MKCCIQNCGNNAKLKKVSRSSTAVSERITFHMFPKDPKQRLSWLESLAIPNWVPTNRTFICSDHFKEDDFYFTKQGTRRIKYGVIPSIEDDCYGPAALRICKLCLSLDRKMYRLNDYGLDKMYQDVMGMPPRTDTNNRLPTGICWECTARLQSAASFRSKALFSDALLQDHLKNNADLKISDIINIHRTHTNLKSTWTVQKVFKFNSHNIEEHAPNTLIKTEVIGIPHNEEIEMEVENLVTDKITIKDERKNEFIEETYPNADVKTEIDLIPITEIAIGEKDTDFEDDDDNDVIVSENIYVNDAKIGFDNVALLKNEEEIETMNLSKNIADSDESDEQMDLSKSVDSDEDDQVVVSDDVCDDDDQTYVSDEVIRNVANEAIVCIEKKKTEVKKKKAVIKRKAKNEDDVIIWVKGRPKKNKQPYVKPSIPIDENIFNVRPLNHDELRQEVLDRRECDKYTQAPFKCDVCFRGFPTKDKQERHVIKHSELTVQNIKSINRLNNQLTSTLSQKHFEVNHYDSYIEHEDQPIIIQDESPPTCNVDVKIENEIFLTDDITDKNDDGLNDDGLNDDGLNDDGINNDGLNDHGINDDGITDVLNDKNDISEKEYVLSEKDNYSSDDNLPLEKCKTKKTRKRKEKEKKPVKPVKRVKKIKEPTEPKIDRRRKPFLNDDLNETLFTITDLTVEEQVAEIVKRQDSSNYKNSVFKCTACFKGFLDEDAYNSHMTRHTDQCGEYECGICKTHFKHPHALRKHITAHHTQRFSCKQCTYITTHRQSSRLHERWHKGTKYRCPHCQDEFVKFTSYMRHIRIKHPSDFVCELCGYSFVSAKGIELHKKLKHRLENAQIPEDGPLCELCNVRFVSPEAHKRHLSVSARHNTGTDKDSRESNKPKKGRKTKECKELERRAREKDKDSDEKRRIYPSQMRKAEGPIPCEQCGLQLEDSRAYHGHFRRMHTDKNRTNYPSMKSPCMCEVCGRIFQSMALLKDHMWVHTGEKRFKCDRCTKSFTQKTNLVFHMKVHSATRPSYECPLCGKHFAFFNNRRRHMFIHTGLKPFKCDTCGKCFTTAGEQRAHVEHVHLKKPWPKRARQRNRDWKSDDSSIED